MRVGKGFSGFKYVFWLLIIALIFRAMPPITLVAGAGSFTVDATYADYIGSWWPSTAHKRVQIEFSDGSRGVAWGAAIVGVTLGSGFEVGRVLADGSVDWASRWTCGARRASDPRVAIYSEKGSSFAAIRS